jgi:hypothetical protein
MLKVDIKTIVQPVAQKRAAHPVKLPHEQL